MHLVQQISLAVKDLLTGLATTGARVHDGFPRQLQDADLPALVIEIGDDTAIPVTKLYPRLMGHVLQLSVLVLVKKAAPPADLHQIRLEVEKALAAAAPSLGGLTTDIRSAGASRREQDNEGELPVGMLPVNFEIDYRHFENAPDVAH